MKTAEEIIGAVGFSVMTVRPGDTCLAMGISDLPILAPGHLMSVMESACVAALVELLEYNKSQLDERIAFLLETVSDEAEIVAMNIKGPTKYSSWRQYQIQNGLTPTEPPITTRYNFYLQKYFDLSVEEMAVKVYGNLRYSFTPIEML